MNKNIIVSEVLRSKADIIDDEPKKKSREDWRKAKELEEARKAGTAPAAVDEEGKDINPHIPQYISSTPWYYGTTGPTLKHQRMSDTEVPKYAGLNEWYKRGVDETKVATKYRKGACENCGAMGHKKKECFERPRKRMAIYSNRNIAPDDFIQPVLNQSYDGKRDRWAGYDPNQYKSIIEQFQKIEETKRQLRAEKLAKAESKDSGDIEENTGDDAEDEDEEDEDKYVDDFDMPGTKVDSKQRITVRNLRIREDTAKYLRNLDPNSAFYDPKTRSMRDNPHKGKDPQDVDYAGENFVRFTGDTQKHASAQMFAWEAYEKGVDVHLLAEPTKLELLKKEYEEKKDEFKSKIHGTILEKYGGEEHLKVPPKELLLAQTEEYREFTRYGKIVKGEEKVPIKSKYEEDVYPLNHTSVWGSYWVDGQWGYQCCHNVVKNSYCTGEAGKAAIKALPLTEKFETKTKEEVNKSSSSSSESSSSESSSSESSSSASSSSDSSSSSNSSSSSDSSSESEEEQKRKSKLKKMSELKKKPQKETKKKRKTKSVIDKKKLKKAMKEQSKKKKLQKKTKKKKKTKSVIDKKKLKEAMKEQSEEPEVDERKRKYNSMYEVKKPSEEELETYYMKRKRDFDPMADFML